MPDEQEHFYILSQTKIFFHLGRLVALSIAQGGSGLPCLSVNTYSYLCGMDIESLTQNNMEVPESNIVDLITEVNCIVLCTTVSTDDQRKAH